MPSLPSRRVRALAIPLLLAIATTAAAPGVLQIRRGDTLSELALRHGTTVAELQRLNDLTGTRIYAGQTLTLPGAPTTTADTGTAGTHTVQRGDTLTGIARRYGVSVTAIAAANDLSDRDVVKTGEELTIPGVEAASSAIEAAPAGRTYPTATLRSAARHRATLASQQVPSKAQMRTIIGSAARSVGVDPALALAIAHQESGFQAHLVSSADAVGAMQVLPGTAEWMSQVAGRRLDVLDPTDNALAGVLLLRTLLRSTGGDDEVAIAGYYQGLRSVTERGMFTDTKAYVKNVTALRARHG